AALVAVAGVAGALAAHRPVFLVGAAVASLVAAVFAARPDLGVLLVLTVRPTLDLWAGGSAAPGAHRFHVAAALAVMVIGLGGGYLLEQRSDVVRAPALRAFLVFAGIAALSI